MLIGTHTKSSATHPVILVRGPVAAPVVHRNMYYFYTLLSKLMYLVHVIPSDPKQSIIAPTVAVACSLSCICPKGIGIHNISELSLCNILTRSLETAVVISALMNEPSGLGGEAGADDHDSPVTSSICSLSVTTDLVSINIFTRSPSIKPIPVPSMSSCRHY